MCQLRTLSHNEENSRESDVTYHADKEIVYEDADAETIVKKPAHGGPFLLWLRQFQMYLASRLVAQIQGAFSAMNSWDHVARPGTSDMKMTHEDHRN